ncbi:OLC1v1026942C1 [Oldenlandia corymbosa var. corymbosa]|uniref:OLC1v1026942C1 n=1 Tax=Oldenlandia corymbosa var. corymbosa TaxID=529605 RepID=A0AAV1CBB2_OLDCO|nr:OLC1v1026942C1 [Oldenlandia corymbosa var. corymbosa]
MENVDYMEDDDIGGPNMEDDDHMEDDHVEDDDIGGPNMEDDDHMEDDHVEDDEFDDEDYTSISEQSAEDQSISEGSRESDEEVEDKFAINDRHIYRSQGKWDHIKVDKDEFQLTMWDRTTATIGKGTCFKNKIDAKKWWKYSKSKSKVVAHCVVGFTDQLSRLRDGDFLWTLYTPFIDVLPDFCKAGTHMYLCRTWIFCWAVREPYEPNQVLRQFWCKQARPEAPLIRDRDRWKAIHYGDLATGKAYDDWVLKQSKVQPHWNVREKKVVPHELVDPALGPQCTVDYMPWFQRRTVRFITDPTQYGTLAQGYHWTSSRERFYIRFMSLF